MSGLRAEVLSPIDAATLWPQLHRLGTEVVAMRAGEKRLVRAGMGATGLAHLPGVPRSILLGVRKRLGYRGILVTRELAGGQSWEVASLRLHRDKDDDAILALLEQAAAEITARAGRGAFLLLPESSPHQAAAARAGFAAYSSEQLYAPPRKGSGIASPSAFREAEPIDDAGVFRLYCRAVPEPVRRQEALTYDEWRAVHHLYGSDREFVREEGGALLGWCGIASHEAHVLLSEPNEELVGEALAVTSAELARSGSLIATGYQPELERVAEERGYLALGRRVVMSRRLGLRIQVEEPAAVFADTFPVPQ